MGKPWRPFLAGEGAGVVFSDDCETAQAEVAALKASPDWQERQRGFRVNDALALLSLLSPTVGGRVDRKALRVNGGDGRRRFVAECLGIEGSWRLTFRDEGGAVEEYKSFSQVLDRLHRYYGIAR